jgi:DNA invertase Pin-like site-specific DNA recombinase
MSAGFGRPPRRGLPHARKRARAREATGADRVRALDCTVDTSTPSGETIANMLATLAQFERRLILQRTKEGLAVKKATGVRLGRPPTLPRAVVRRIQRQRARCDGSPRT